jgi:hypothetical protein
MYYQLMRLQSDERRLGRTTQDGTQYLMGPVPGGPKPDPLPPRAQAHRPVADALAAWRARDAQSREMKRDPSRLEVFKGYVHNIARSLQPARHRS